eukprot:4944599-Ditylum_brightwellii.AAC.1
MGHQQRHERSLMLGTIALLAFTSSQFATAFTTSLPSLVTKTTPSSSSGVLLFNKVASEIDE